MNVTAIKKIQDYETDMSEEYLLLSLVSYLKYYPPYTKYIQNTFSDLLDKKLKFPKIIFSQKTFNFEPNLKFEELNNKISQINKDKKTTKTKKEIKVEKLKDNSKSVKGSLSELLENSEKTNSNSLFDEQNKSKDNKIIETKLIDTLNNELSIN